MTSLTARQRPIPTLMLIALLSWSAAWGIPVSPGTELPDGSGPFVVRAFFGDDRTLQSIAELSRPWLIDRDGGFAVIELDRQGLLMLASAGIPFYVDQVWTARTRSMRGLALKTIPGFACYRTVEETRDAARELVRNRPDLAERIQIGESWRRATGQGGYPIEVLRLTNEKIPASRPPIFINGAIHAREYATGELVTRFAEALVNNYDTDPEASWLLDHRELHLVLVANPDGRKHAETGILWRKNANTDHCAGERPGVDLNRNFSFEWGLWDGSSGDACSEVFRGPAPVSEPETQALENYLRNLFGDHRPHDLVTPADLQTPGLFIDVHSFGRLVLYPWAFPGQSVPNAPQLRAMSRKLAFFNRYRAASGLFLYPTDGTTTDFVYGELGLASFTFEIGDWFFEACSGFDEILDGNQAALRYAAAAADAPYLRSAGPDISEMLVLPNVIVPGEPVTLRLVGDDGRYGTLGGTELSQDVTRFEVRIERPGAIEPLFEPIAKPGLGTVDVEIDSGDLAVGRYRVTARARDTTGQWGVWRAAWLDVVDPAKTGVIAGQVRSVTDNRPVRAVISSGDARTRTDPETGRFQLRVQAGTHRLSVSAEEFGSVTVPETAIEPGDQRERNARLQPFCEVFREDAEGGLPGWTAEGAWSTTDEDAFEGKFSITDSPGGPYADNTSFSLYSPEIDLTAYRDASLRFFYRCQTEREMDFGQLFARRGSSLRVSRLLDCTGDSADWQEHVADLGSFAGSDQLTLQFRMSADLEVNGDGFYIDDLRLLGEADSCPLTGPPEYALSGELTGTWFDPDRSGEGFVFEIGETDSGPVMVATWYTHEAGEPLWLIGSAPVDYREAAARIELFRSGGTGFGEQFDPAAVELTPWGRLDVAFSSRTAATVSYQRAGDGLSGDFDLIRLTGDLRRQDADPVTPRPLLGHLSGAWYEPERPGQGLTVEFSENAQGPVAVVTWYTYLDGEPRWLIGSAPIGADDRRIGVSMSSYSGTGFGPEFDGEALQATPWGELTLEFGGCNQARLEYDFEQGQGALELTRLTRGLAGVRCFSRP